MGKKSDEGKKRNIEINVESPDDTTEATVEQTESDEVVAETTDEKESERKISVDEKSEEQIIDDYKQKVSELEDRHLRLVAEFDNYKKRTARQFEDIIKNSGEKIIVPLLEVIDNFERALASASEGTDFNALHEGMELTYQQINDILKREGVEPIDAVGESFDPNLHEAMLQVNSDKYPEGVIAQEISRGYKLNGRVIRFSKVAVSAGAGDNDDKPEKDDKAE